MNANACLSKVQLSEFLAGGNDDTLTDEIHAHIANCLRCQAELESISYAKSQTARLRVPPAAGEQDDEVLPQQAARRLQNGGSPDSEPMPASNQFKTTVFSEHPSDRLSDDAGDSDPAVDLELEGYVIRGEIGRGGMGLVFAAHDLTLDREVAIKTVISRSNATSVRERFIRESKIAARLAHPGIPPVHALGKLRDGSPFLAMKLVRGKTMAALLSSRSSASDDFSRLLQIFQQVAQAVGFAHINGIIHRDLKPENIMVGEFGEVQVMDWGLAKDLQTSELASETGGNETCHPGSVLCGDNLGETRYGTIMGSPSFMAPEQARGEAVGSPADVFSLGAILCVILTGKTPFEGGRSASEIIHLAAAGELAAAFAKLDNCGADPELITLAKRCLAPDVETRPDNSGEVANAIAAYRLTVEKRLQQAETDRATAETRVIEQRKRWRLGTLAATALLAVLVAGIAISTQQASRAITAEKATAAQLQKTKLAKQEAESARDIAKNRYQIAMSAFNDMIFAIQNKLETKPDTLELRKALLAGARNGLRKLLDDSETHSEPEQKLVWAHMQMGVIDELFGENDQARKEFENGHELAKRLAKSNPERSDVQHDLSAALSHLGDEAMRRKDSLKALDWYKQKIEIDRRISAKEPNNTVHQRDLSLSLGRMGQVSLQHGQVQEGYEYYKQKLEISLRLAHAEPSSELFQRDLANSYELVGNAAAYLNHADEVLANYQKMSEIMQRLLNADPSDVKRQRDLGISLTKLGNFCEDTNQLNSALGYYEQAAIMLKRLASADPQNTKLQCELFIGYDNLSNVELARNEYSKAAGWLAKAREVVLPLHEKQQLVGELQNALAATEQKIAQCEEFIRTTTKLPSDQF